MMPPGWHVTTGPGALLFPTDLRSVEGNDSLEAQVFLFPGKSAEEYSVFIGGSASDAGAGRIHRVRPATRWTGRGPHALARRRLDARRLASA